jgi:hypothetical protein
MEKLVSVRERGLRLYRFEFAAADGRSLIVLTGSNEAEPSLFRWWVE